MLQTQDFKGEEGCRGLDVSGDVILNPNCFAQTIFFTLPDALFIPRLVCAPRCKQTTNKQNFTGGNPECRRSDVHLGQLLLALGALETTVHARKDLIDWRVVRDQIHTQSS
jgi:hypothetical protein